jgi:chorismate mutase
MTARPLAVLAAIALLTAPDLSESRSAIDGYNKGMVNGIALQWNSLHGPNCRSDLAAAEDAVVASRKLDPLYQQALSSATQSYCSRG